MVAAQRPGSHRGSPTPMSQMGHALRLASPMSPSPKKRASASVAQYLARRGCCVHALEPSLVGSRQLRDAAERETLLLLSLAGAMGGPGSARAPTWMRRVGRGRFSSQGRRRGSSADSERLITGRALVLNTVTARDRSNGTDASRRCCDLRRRIPRPPGRARRRARCAARRRSGRALGGSTSTERSSVRRLSSVRRSGRRISRL